MEVLEPPPSTPPWPRASRGSARVTSSVKAAPGQELRRRPGLRERGGRPGRGVNHHPDIDIRWNTVTLRLTTHSAGGITDARPRPGPAHRRPCPPGWLSPALEAEQPFRYVPAPGSWPASATSSWTAHRGRARCAPCRIGRARPPRRAVARRLGRDRPAAPWRAPSSCPTAVEAASIDHFDADGVIALALLCVDGLAAEHGPLLVEAARVGDFDVVTDRRAALVAFGVAALAGVAHAAPRSARPSRGRQHGPHGVGGHRSLRLLPALAEDPERHRELWAGEAAAFDASCAALRDGWASIEERPEHDLAVVRVDDHPPRTRPGGVGRRAPAPGRRALRHRVHCGWRRSPGARSRSATATSRGCGW